MTIPHFPFYIAGIPCQIETLSIEGDFVPAKVDADPDSCYPAEYPEIDWRILDRKGYPAPWLETKASDAERREVETLLLNEFKALHRKPHDDY